MQTVEVQDPRRADAAPLPRYERSHGLHVLRVAGDDYEIGYQHGSLLRDAIGRGPLPYFESYVERMIAAGVGPVLGAALGRVLRATVGQRIARGFPDHARRALEGLADGSGIPRATMIGAVTQPET